MINKLIQWALNNRVLVLVAALLLTVFGIHTATRMPVDVFPDLTAPTVTVITEAHGMSPTEVETQITFPVETAVNGASGGRAFASPLRKGRGTGWGQGEGLASADTSDSGTSKASPSPRPSPPSAGEREKNNAFGVVLRASVEIQSSIVFATLIIALVFVPIFFLAGVEGRLLQPLGVAYLVAIMASLLVALIVTPVLCYLLLPESKAVVTEHEPKFVKWLKERFNPVLNAVLNHPWRVTLPAVAVLAVALVSISFMGRAFLPEFNEGSLTISAVTLPGTSLTESDALGRVVEQTLLSFPEVVSVARRTGRAELDEHAQGVEAAELDVSIKMKDRNKREFLEALRAAFSQVPGMNITIGQPISHRIDHMLSGTRANIAVKIFGNDLYQLRALAEKARQAMQGVAGVVDLSVETQTEVPVLKVNFNRAAIARHGLTIRDVARTLEAALQGVKASRVLEGLAAYDLVVRLDDEVTPHPSPLPSSDESRGRRAGDTSDDAQIPATSASSSLSPAEGERAGVRGQPSAASWRLDTLGDVLVDTPAGAKVPLYSLAQIQRDTGPNQILREQVERKIVVQCNVAGRDVTGVVHDIQKLVTPPDCTRLRKGRCRDQSPGRGGRCCARRSGAR